MGKATGLQADIQMWQRREEALNLLRIRRTELETDGQESGRSRYSDSYCVIK